MFIFAKLLTYFVDSVCCRWVKLPATKLCFLWRREDPELNLCLEILWSFFQNPYTKSFALYGLCRHCWRCRRLWHFDCSCNCHCYYYDCINLSDNSQNFCIDALISKCRFTIFFDWNIDIITCSWFMMTVNNYAFSRHFTQQLNVHVIIIRFDGIKLLLNFASDQLNILYPAIPVPVCLSIPQYARVFPWGRPSVCSCSLSASPPSFLVSASPRLVLLWNSKFKINSNTLLWFN